MKPDLAREIEAAIEDDESFEYIAGVAGQLQRIDPTNPALTEARTCMIQGGIRTVGGDPQGESLRLEEGLDEYLTHLHAAVGHAIHGVEGLDLDEVPLEVMTELEQLDLAICGLTFVGDTELAALVEREVVAYIRFHCSLFMDYIDDAQEFLEDLGLKAGHPGFNLWGAVLQTPELAAQELTAGSTPLETLPSWLPDLIRKYGG